VLFCTVRAATCCRLTPALLAAQEFSPSGDGGTPVTMGAYARDLFLDQVRLPAVLLAHRRVL
jgi:hypothetical protein